MKYLIAIILLASSVTANAGEISKIFGEGVFGTKWGDTPAQVKQAFPKGKVEKYGDIIQFVVKDGRSVLGIERSSKATIRFGFDSESRLVGVVVYFKGDDFGDVLAKLSTHFGQPVEPKQGNYVTIQWPEDNSTQLMLAVIPSGFSMETALTISNTGLSKPEVSKEALGF